MRILVVDDNRDIVELVQRVLRIEGHEVVIARDGLEALQQEATTQPDMIILDVNLPALDAACDYLCYTIPCNTLRIHPEQGAQPHHLAPDDDQAVRDTKGPLAYSNGRYSACRSHHP